ncbi:MAG: hypothetical protein NTW21_21965 [Verrucomicrobia bacterium]|nr:hypothetical protein [Verrucomicrobiota bacterium]
MRILCFCLLLLCPAFSHAQDGRKVTCRFLCFDGVEPPPPLLNVFDKGIEVTCKIPADSFSPVTICFAKADAITFLAAEDRKPVATARIPAGVATVILVFVPAEKLPNVLPWRVFVIEDTAKNFPNGGAFVANFYTKDIRFLIGEDKIMLQSGKFHGFAMPKQRDAFNMAPVIFQFQQDDSWRTASESMLRFVPGMRYLIFAFVDPASGRPRISTYKDLAPLEIPPKKK